MLRYNFFSTNSCSPLTSDGNEGRRRELVSFDNNQCHEMRKKEEEKKKGYEIIRSPSIW
jgi:hypothetical protein